MGMMMHLVTEQVDRLAAQGLSDEFWLLSGYNVQRKLDDVKEI
jgi:hypothetical protein